MPAQIIKTSIFTGRTHRMIFKSIDQDEFDTRLSYYLNNVILIQDVFPELTNDEREFIMTGITPEEWEKFINNEPY